MSKAARRKRQAGDPLRVQRPAEFSRMIGQLLAERRRSHAAGAHGKAYNRASARRTAIQQSREAG